MTKIVEKQTWKNWAHTSVSTPEKIIYPSSIEEVCTIVKDAALHNKKIRVVGAGHSFTKIVQTNDWLLSLDLLSGIQELNEEEDTATILAGTRLYAIGEALGKKGYSQENLGDVNVQSIAGALSTGTHGTGLAFGNVSTQVIALKLVTASGEVLSLSEKNNPEYFKASLVSLGMLGIIVEVTVRIIKSPVYEYISDKISYEHLEKHLEALIHTNRHFEFYLFPFSDLVQVKTMNITDKSPQSLKGHYYKNLILENYLFYIISETCRIFPKTSSFFSKMSAKAIGKANITSHSYNLFATPRLVRFREVEYSIPLEHMKSVLREIRKQIETKRYNVHFPIECRTVKGDEIWLSPAYNRDSFYIAFHMYKGMPYEEYFYDMEQIMKKYEGRPHWGKMHKRSNRELRDLYPKFTDFQIIRNELDPKGIFLNDYLADLFSNTTENQVLNL
ncbi:D-arabinono-1,4-lactone oxidase [Bacillus massiliigorillae]|uniref:D-arabinono-1,4-lactone oxidase n=1 Tax=Bacillus massiliigorillae TaxID=1243664 RepID=UPI0003A96E6D|nr:D-arabinono-1,4-lactone oxidase [Bacillus massiliigorillae]